MASEYGYMCSNYNNAEVYQYDEWWECMDHCEEDEDCTGGYFYDYGETEDDLYYFSCRLFGTGSATANWCEPQWCDEGHGAVNPCYAVYRVYESENCVDTNNGTLSAYGSYGCSDSDGGSPGLWCSTLDDDDYTATDMCCSCGGGFVPHNITIRGEIMCGSHIEVSASPRRVLRSGWSRLGVGGGRGSGGAGARP